MSGVPYTFATATTSIPLSQLDVNFATNATLGNASVGLGNTTTTVGNLTLTNTTITTGNVTTDLTIHGLTVGQGAGSLSTNTVVGYNALSGSNTGIKNTIVGYTSMVSNTSGSDNVAVGKDTLQANTTGGTNVAIGEQSLYSNTTASNNTAVGYQAGYSNNTGTYNTFCGYQAGYSYSGTGNSSNICIGAQAGYSLTTGTNNTFVGPPAGYLITTGSKNTIIGGFLGNSGGLDIRTASNYIVLSDGDGNPGAYWSNGGGWYQKNNSTLWSITSDERIKKNITTNTDGLDKISQIQIRNFEYRLPTEIDSTLNQDLAVNITGTQLGVIAQELQAILPDCVTTQDSGILSVNASNVFWHLVTAVQQLNAQVIALQAKVGV